MAGYVLKNIEKHHFSQRNNELEPLISCNVTSMVMAWDFIRGRTPFPEGDYKQPEDNFRAFLLSKGYLPTVHEDLSKGFNEWIGREVTRFSTNTFISQITKEIKRGYPVVLSGDFPYMNKNGESTFLKHIDCLVGIDPGVSITVNDPYGNPTDNFKGSGCGVVLPWENFITWFKTKNRQDKKWAHVFEYEGFEV